MSDQETYCNSITSPPKRDCKKFYTSTEDLMLLRTAVMISPFTRNYGTIMKSWAKVSRIMQDQGMPSSATRCRDRVKLLLSYLAHNNIEKIATSDENSEETDEKLRLLRQLEISRHRSDGTNGVGTSSQAMSIASIAVNQNNNTNRSDRYHRSCTSATMANSSGRQHLRKRSRDEMMEEEDETLNHQDSNEESASMFHGGESSQNNIGIRNVHGSSFSSSDNLLQLIHLLKDTTEKYYQYQSRLLEVEGKELDVDLANLEADRRRLELAVKEKRARQQDRMKRLELDREERIKLIQFIEEKL